MGDKNKEFVIDNQSPYNLHPLDAPRMIITTLKFDRMKNELREKVVLTTLTAKNKVAFIDGTISKPKMQKGAY